jgi:uncharacterized membrane protein
MNTTKLVVIGLTISAALASGLMAGVFFAFSSFVMKALGRIPSAEGISAMQSINVLAVRSGFLVVFMGTALACLTLVVISFWRLDAPAGWLALAGGATYLLGGFLVTAVCNVPMNDSLAALTPSDPSAATYWAVYLRDWTFWNHIRTAACFVSSGLFTLSLMLSERP